MSKKSRGITKLSFYEQVGIIIPGSAMLFGLFFFIPDLRGALTKDGVSVGQLGIFVLLSYAAGHLVAAVGNAVEWLMWKAFGGMPSDWIVREDQTLLAPEQLNQLREKLQVLMGICVEKVTGMDVKTWKPISRQIYAKVMKDGQTSRIDTFNGNYGLNRGLASAMLVLTVFALTQSLWWAAFGLIVVGSVFLYRAHRFGVYYGRELYLQFLIMSDQPKPPPKISRKKEETA
ncbi:hypothetical protein ABIF65_002609 [Bradyrhizobium japonicum]|uniref:hypothetical protein n=1 Tax=Bradyrhizobium TaxID=374 RepID=UPI000402F46A|nr:MULTISPECIES: hypothetical protein [Bradyrhizobium]MBP1064658.1 hypothetical protein [Bradyrhizobium japonicum]MBR0884305.1 hypothetical protein [Bradyrhizobium liaoningense]MBR1004720.1 hypothetical protein [Bradyrhizobium liaoningense]MBR1070160.1 hypothetical protein [Bradyrhizobium liaoningense]MCP1742226.1 hypothetical protein [Bradyrhizobium japonicum]